MIRLTQTADGWKITVTSQAGPTSLLLGQHEVAVVGYGADRSASVLHTDEPEPDLDEVAAEAGRSASERLAPGASDSIASDPNRALNADKVPLNRMVPEKDLAREREWWIRQAQRESAAAEREKAEAVAKERALWADEPPAQHVPTPTSELFAETIRFEREQMRLRCEGVVAERFYRDRPFCRTPAEYEVVREEVRACVEAIKGLREIPEQAVSDAFTTEREWWIRRAEREAEAAAQGLAEAVEREKNIWIDQVDAAEREERARCLAWAASGWQWSDILKSIRDGEQIEAPKQP